MKCDARVASTSPKTKLGLPEVKLGLLPGWGGTYALPKLVGLTEALPMILQGKEVRPDKAKKIGLVDAVCDPAALEDLAVQTALSLASGADSAWKWSFNLRWLLRADVGDTRRWRRGGACVEGHRVRERYKSPVASWERSRRQDATEPA